MLSELLDLIAEQTSKPRAEITPETRIEHLGIDSLDFIDLTQGIGEKFKPIPDADFAKMDTVGDILAAIS